MQKNTLQIRDRLLTGLDKENNVVNPKIVVDVLSQLDHVQITIEELEATRLGKHINELRKRTNDGQIKAKAKSLLKKWRNAFVSSNTSSAAPSPALPPSAPTPSSTTPAAAATAAATAPVAKTNGEPPPGGGNGGKAAAVVNGMHNHRQKPAAAAQPSAAQLRATSSSLPSSTSSSPGLSRPSTPISATAAASAALHHHNRLAGNSKSTPVSPAVNSGGGGSKLTNGLSHHLNQNGRRQRPDSENSDVDVVGCDADDVIVPTAAKRQRLLNGPVNPAHARMNGHSLHHNSSQISPPLSENSLGRNQQHPSCDSKPAAAVSNVMTSESSASKPPPGRRKTRASRGGPGLPAGGGGGGSSATLADQTDILKHQMQNVRRVRTTQELVQELAMMRSTSPGLPPSNRSSLTAEDANHMTTGQEPKASSSTVVEETREELMSRFFDSQDGSGGGSRQRQQQKHSDLSPPTSLGVPSPPSEPPAAAGTGKKDSADEILAQLPPIDPGAILAQMARDYEMEDGDEEEEEDDGLEVEGLIPAKKPDPVMITDEMVAKLNGEDQTESFNGNFGHDGDFKEWHEVVSKTTVNGDLIHILPYSVID